MSTIGRNDPCHCGSGKKYKKCCEEKDVTKQHKEFEKKWKAAEKALPKDQPESGEGKESSAHKSPRRPEQGRSGVPNRHQSFVGPKVSMPRKSGGG